MTLTTSAAIILDARAVSGPAKGILQIGQGATERTSVARPRNRLILLHVTYNHVNTHMYAQTNSEHEIYLCSKSTGAVTSCTRKYLASAGYFRATASYIA